MIFSDLSRATVNVAWDVLQTIANTLRPWTMRDIFSRCGLPPVDLGIDWSDAVAQAQADLSSGSISDAEWASRIALLADTLADRFRDALELSSIAEVATWLRPPASLALFASLSDRADRHWMETGVAWICGAMLLTDIRVQESLLGSSPTHRTEQGFWPVLEQAPDEVKAATALLLAELGIELLDRYVIRRGTSLSARQWRFGFDVPAHESPLSGDGPADALAVAREAARWTFCVEYNLENIELLSARYDVFDTPTPIVAPFATAFRFTFVPVPASSRFDAEDTSRPAMVLINLGGDFAQTEHFGDGTLSMSVSGDAGILLPVPRMKWDWPQNWDWSPPGSFVEVTGGVEMAFQYATARRARADADPAGVSLTVDRFVTEGRVSVTGGVGSGPGGAGSLGVASARLDLEGVTLTVGQIPGMSCLTTRGISVTFDAGLVATWELGGTPDFGFRGAAGGELVIPMGQASIGGFRISQVRVKVHAGRASDSADAPSGVRLDVLADVSLRIGALAVAADGVGLQLSAGTTDEPTGNVAGVVHVGWEPVYPTRMGIALDCPMFRGEAFADYDASDDRWSGGGQFALGKKVTFRGLVLSETSPAGAKRSWLALATAEFDLGWFIGAGVLFAQNRTTDPAALLAAVAAGDLEAILFPSEIASRGAAYIATLGRLLPAVEDGWVAGIFLAFSWLGGRVRADLGVMYDAGASERAYLLARLRIALPTLDDPLTKIEVAALGVWDRARDEYELRASLINSHLLGGELTGEALMFSGRANPDERTSGHVRLISIGGFHPKYVVPGPAIHVPERVSLLVQRGDHLRLECQAYLAITPGALQLGLESSLVARFAGFGIRGNLGFDALINTSLEFLISVRVGVALYLGSRMLLGASLEGELGLVGEGNAAQAYLRGRARISFWFFDYETPRFTVSLLYITRAPTLSRDPVDSLYDAIMENSNWDNGGTPGVLVRPPVDPSTWRVSPSAPLRFTQALVPLDVPITHYESVALPQTTTLAVEVDRPVGATWTTTSVDEEFAPSMFFSLTPEEKLAVRGFEYLPGGVELERPLAAGVAIDVGLECEELVIDRSNPPESTRSIVIESEIAALGHSLGPHLSIFQQGPSRQPATLRAEQFAVLDARGDVVAIDRSFTAAFGYARGLLGHEVVPMREVA